MTFPINWMNILFVCKYNKFRSKVAEALFNYHNKDKKMKVKSAGLMKDFQNQFIIKPAALELTKRKIPYEDKKSDIINPEMIKWADKIVVVANDIPMYSLPEEKTLFFSIPDAYSSPEETKKTVSPIEKLVLDLIRNMSRRS